MKYLVYFGIALFFAIINAGIYDVLTPLVFDIFRTLIFTISLLYFLWHYKITKTHVPSYNRVSEGAIICAVIFNPMLPFELDIVVWVFLETVFMWVFAIYITVIRKIEKNIQRNNRHWIDLE